MAHGKERVGNKVEKEDCLPYGNLSEKKVSWTQQGMKENSPFFFFVFSNNTRMCFYSISVV